MTDMPTQANLVCYPDVIDALSRGLITEREASAVVRAMFRLIPETAGWEGQSDDRDN